MRCTSAPAEVSGSVTEPVLGVLVQGTCGFKVPWHAQRAFHN